jgi:hypothetical protein
MKDGKKIALTAAAATATLLCPTGSSANAAPAGLQRVSNQSVTDVDPEKDVDATCPQGTRLVGGGGSVNDGRAGKVLLTALAPLSPPGFPNMFSAVARNLDAQFTGSWSVTAYAIRASGATVPAHLVTFQSPTLHKVGSFKTDAVPCPAGQRALSAGGWTDLQSPGRAGLQLVRTSAPRDIARSTARVTQPTEEPWVLSTLAVCADPVIGVGSPVQQFFPGKAGQFSCPQGKKVYGVGGGGSLTESGNSYLNSVVPSADLRDAKVTMTAPPAGGMVVQVICGPAS